MPMKNKIKTYYRYPWFHWRYSSKHAVGDNSKVPKNKGERKNETIWMLSACSVLEIENEAISRSIVENVSTFLQLNTKKTEFLLLVFIRLRTSRVAEDFSVTLDGAYGVQVS